MKPELKRCARIQAPGVKGSPKLSAKAPCLCVSTDQFTETTSFEAANPNAGNTVRAAAAATGSGKTPPHLPPATKETRIIVQRSKQLPPLPPNAIRVVVRPRGELRLRDVPAPRLTKALQAKLQITLPNDFCLRIHPTNNTFAAAATHSSTAEILKTLTSRTIGSHTYPCVAYVAPPTGRYKRSHLKCL
ncbi:hypothetical protein MTO96_034502 [Rhipicephalus appendiculatus]